MKQGVQQFGVSTSLCLHSPAVVASNTAGRPVCHGGPANDLFGDALMGCKELPGDTWRHRHNTIKVAISRECLASKLPHNVEVYSLFAPLLPAVVTQQGKVQINNR